MKWLQVHSTFPPKTSIRKLGDESRTPLQFGLVTVMEYMNSGEQKKPRTDMAQLVLELLAREHGRGYELSMEQFREAVVQRLGPRASQKIRPAIAQLARRGLAWVTPPPPGEAKTTGGSVGLTQRAIELIARGSGRLDQWKTEAPNRWWHTGDPANANERGRLSTPAGSMGRRSRQRGDAKESGTTLRLDELPTENSLVGGVPLQVAPLQFGPLRPQLFWDTLLPRFDISRLATMDVVGRSALDRPIYGVRCGLGPHKIIVWAGAAGTDIIATLALADMLLTLAHSFHPGIEALRRQISVIGIPLLNPDGAAATSAHNAQGLTITHDGRLLATPEARALISLCEEEQPECVISLCDQVQRHRIAHTDQQPDLCLHSPPEDSQLRRRAAETGSGIFSMLENAQRLSIARTVGAYDVRELEHRCELAGSASLRLAIALPGRKRTPEQQRMGMRTAIHAALEAATRARDFAAADLIRVPIAQPGLHELVIRGGFVVCTGTVPARADLAIGRRWPSSDSHGIVTALGDLAGEPALDVLDIGGRFVHADFLPASTGGGSAAVLTGSEASFTIRESEDARSPALYVVRGPSWRAVGEARAAVRAAAVRISGEAPSDSVRPATGSNP